MQGQGEESVPASTADRTAVLLIAHGSRQQAANDDLHELARRLPRWAVPDRRGCFLELAEPDIRPVETDASRAAQPCADDPLFPLGRRPSRTRPDGCADELSRRHPDVTFLLGSPLGPHPLLDDLVPFRIRELDAVD